MNFQSSKSYRQVYSWAGKSTPQTQDVDQFIQPTAGISEQEQLEIHFRKLFRYGIGFLVLLILAPFIMLGLAIAIATVL
ncbi:MAG: hypothetical protein AAFZ63_02395 [Bacteroidota bacterium]